LPVSPADKVWQLSVGEQQRVEILKMVYRGAHILVLDEPTTSLTPQETDALFAILRGMAARGNSVIFISHKMDEVMSLSHRIAVLRQGKVVGNLPTREASEQELAYLMVGRNVVTRMSSHAAAAVHGPPLVSIRGLCVIGRHGTLAVENLDLDVSAGEIVGVAGVDGNGQTEMVEALAGLRPALSGQIRIEGQAVHGADPLQRMKQGVAYIPAERRSRGSVPGLSIAVNSVLKSHQDPPVSRSGVLDQHAIREHADRLVADYDIRCASVQAPAGTLSGGNLQKLILGREVSAQPKLLIAEQPTRGLDIGSVEIVRQRILQQRERGAAILYLSTDLDEILAISDRIVVFYRGKIVYECPNTQGTSRERIGLAMAGKTEG
jgi:simple sugar transport system ATP-binding protein